MKKSNGYSQLKSRAKQTIKRNEATKRNQEWQSLGDKQKLAILANRPGQSKKQINKIGQVNKNR